MDRHRQSCGIDAELVGLVEWIDMLVGRRIGYFWYHTRLCTSLHSFISQCSRRSLRTLSRHNWKRVSESKCWQRFATAIRTQRWWHLLLWEDIWMARRDCSRMLGPPFVLQIPTQVGVSTSTLRLLLLGQVSVAFHLPQLWLEDVVFPTLRLVL